VRHTEPSHVGVLSGHTVTEVETVGELPAALEQYKLKVEAEVRGDDA
jgi:hypothetical protein